MGTNIKAPSALVAKLRRLFSFRQLSVLFLGLLTAAVAVSASAQDPFSVAASRAYSVDLRSFGIQQHRPRSVRGLPVASQTPTQPASSAGLVFYFPTVTVPDNSTTTFNIEWSCYTLSGPVPDVVSGQYGSVNPSGQGVTLTNIPSSEPVGQWFSVDAVVSSTAPAGQYGIGIFGNGEAQYDQYCGSNGLYSAAGIMNVLGSRDNLGCRDCANGNQPMVGDPINVTAANLYEDEIDFRSPIGTLPLEIDRHFNSSNQIIGLFGDDWTSNFDVALFGNQSAATARLPDGQEIGFTNNGSGWVPQTTVPATLTTNASGYLLVKTDTDDQYQFNSSGQIISQTNVRGEKLIYTRNPSNTFEISSVSDNYGNSMSFTYYTYTTASGSHIYLVHTATVMGQTYTYTYDPNYFNLTTVSYTLNVNGTNKTVSRQYQYNAADPYQLTGIVDENGNTVANIGYDANDLPYYSDAGGTESMTIDYTNLFSTNPSVTVTNANGYQQLYSLAHNSDGTAYVDTIAGQVSGNQNVTPATTYTVDNSQDLPQTVIDGNGYGTQYGYDPTRAILTQKTQGYQWDGVSFISPSGAVGSPHLNETGAMSKMQVTKLDPVFPYPDQIMYSGKNLQGQWVNTKQIDAGYDSVNGRLTSWKETDLTGNASTGSSPRTTTYSYTYYDSSAKTKVNQEFIYGPRYVAGVVNDVTELDYDTSGRLTTKKDGSNHSWGYAGFTSTGMPTQITDNQNGTITTVSYDQKNRPQLITLASNTAQWEVEQMVYYPNGLLQETIRPDGSYLQYGYDNAGHLNQITDGAGNVVTLSPNNLDGQWTSLSITNASSSTVQAASRAFDDIGRLLSATGNFGTQTTDTYDLNNNLQSSYQNGDQTTQLTRVYDALNRVQQLQHAPVGGGSSTTPYETNTYDATGALTKVIDPRGLSTTYTVDGLGNVVAQTSPDTGPATLVHDAAGNLIQRTDNKGQVVKYTYDAIDRLTSIVSVVNSTSTTLATYTYDQTDNCGQLTATHGCGYGRLTSMTDVSGTTDFAYDGIGHLLRKTQVTNGFTLVTAYSYYANTDDVQTMTLPSGTIIGYTWDNNGHISSMTLTPVGSTKANLVTNILYQPFDGPLSWTLGNGEQVGRNYDLDGAVSGDPIESQVDYSADKQALQDITLGGGSSFSAPTVTYSGYRSFTYDNFFHVTGLTGTVAEGSGNPSTLSLGYSSDSADNRLTYNNGSTTVNYTPSTTSNQLATSKKGIVTTHYYYDLNGNFTGNSSTTPTNTYDALNRLVQYVSGKTTATYAYNGRSERVLKTVGTTTTLFVYDGVGHLIGEYNGTTPIEETIWLGDMPVAIQEPSGTYYIHSDYRNVPRQIDNSKKQVLWAWDPYVFGDTNPDQNPPGLPFSTFIYNLRFPGQYYDAESGNFYNYFRDYNPALGRYLESDPLGLTAGVNTYAYVRANPLLYVDHKGLHSSGSYFDCLADCIRANDPLANPADDYSGDIAKILSYLAVGSFPKTWVGLPSIGSPYTNFLSWSSLGSGTAASGANLLRLAGRTLNPMVIAYGDYLFAAELYCAANCAMQESCTSAP